MDHKETMHDIFSSEEKVREKTDEKGEKWIKKYVGGGAHFDNWLQQYNEVYGEKNVEREEIDPSGYQCYKKGNEKMYRIWVKERK